MVQGLGDINSNNQAQCGGNDNYYLTDKTGAEEDPTASSDSEEVETGTGSAAWEGEGSWRVTAEQDY